MATMISHVTSLTELQNNITKISKGSYVIAYDMAAVTQAFSDYCHSHNLQCVVYLDALRVCYNDPSYFPLTVSNGYENVTIPDKTWSQYDPTSNASWITTEGGYSSKRPRGIPGAWEAWHSPLGPFVTRVTIPRVNYALSKGFDGVFIGSFELDRHNTYPTYQGDGADMNPKYAAPIRQKIYDCKTNYQDYRKASLWDMASRICNTVQGSNKKLWYCDDNIYMQTDAMTTFFEGLYGVNLTGVQDFVDGNFCEFVGYVEDGYPADPVAGASTIMDRVAYVKTWKSLTKQMLVQAFTKRSDVMTRLRQEADTHNIWVWGDYNYFNW